MAEQEYWKEHSFFRVLPEAGESFTISEDTFYEMPLTGGYGLNDAYYNADSDTWFVEIFYQGLNYWAEIFWEDWDWKACYELEKDIFPKELEDKIVKEKKTLTVSMPILGTYCVHGYWLQLQFTKDLVGSFLCLYDESKEHLHAPEWVDKAVGAQRKFPLNNLFTVHMDIQAEAGKTQLDTAGLARFGLKDIHTSIEAAPQLESQKEDIETLREALDDVVDQASQSLYELVNEGAFSRIVPASTWKHCH